MYKIILLVFTIGLFCTLPCGQTYGQSSGSNDTVIRLHPDTTDTYIISYYISGRYRIEIGYKAYLKELLQYDSNCEVVVKHYIDSVKNHQKMVALLPGKIELRGSPGYTYTINMNANIIVSDLFLEGNLKVYDFHKKSYLQKVKRIRSNSYYESYYYIDAITGKLISYIEIASPL